MDIKPTKCSPVLTDTVPINKSRLGNIHSNVYVRTINPRKKPSMYDDVISNGWLDAMRSSSPPPRKRVLMDFNVDVANSDDHNNKDLSYHSWMVKFPSALNSFDRIAKRAKNKRVVIFLDYDGTLSPIVDDPDRAFMSDDMRSAVRSLAKYFPTAIISGRNRDKVYELVGLPELYYAGSHGMDIMLPVDHLKSIISANQQDMAVNLFQPAKEFLPTIDEVFRTLAENTKDIKGVKVENHKFCASVHYRNVDEKNWSTIAQRVHDILKDYPQLRLTHGRKVLEVRPVINWNKGKAVEFLLESLVKTIHENTKRSGLGSSKDVLPIYIGDDRTDEDAFKVLRKGNRGCGILVSPVPKESKAFFSLRDPLEVQEFLKTLVMWKEQCVEFSSLSF